MTTLEERLARLEESQYRSEKKLDVIWHAIQQLILRQGPTERLEQLVRRYPDTEPAPPLQQNGE